MIEERYFLLKNTANNYCHDNRTDDPPESDTTLIVPAHYYTSCNLKILKRLLQLYHTGNFDVGKLLLYCKSMFSLGRGVQFV